MTTLVVTNDFPPRIGGIESFVSDVCSLLGDRVVVLTSSSPGAASYDRGLAFPVVRRPTPVLLPTAGVAAHAARLIREHSIERVVFGAAAPLALMTPALRQAGVRRVLAITHGHERWWAHVPGASRLLRRIGDQVDVLSTISDDVATAIAPALSPAARAKIIRLAPPVDTVLFRPADDRRTDPPRCIAVGRLVARKGFATLIAAWSRVLGRWPVGVAAPELVLVGDGPLRGSLERLAGPYGTSIRFTGALPRPAVADQLRSADVFAFPVRDRRHGLDREGLGLAALEAASCGLPVVVGRSGGAPETVEPGRTGYVVDGTDPGELGTRVSELLLDPAQARTMGAAGRQRVITTYASERVRDTLRSALLLDADH